ncbi:MAG: PHP-associated domain-containing protein [Desulfosalsimonadaceae bacterium]
MELIHRVAFEKPDLSELTAHHTVVDMHFHSRHSDGLNHISSIVRRARKLGIGIAVTDHNAIEGAVRLDTYDDILTIPGIEVTSREGAHLLVYFYNIDTLVQFYESDVRPFMGKGVMASLSLDMHGIIRRARQYKSLILFPHPHSAIYTGICNPMISKDHQERLLGMVDGVEVINAGNLEKWNLQCAVLGFNLGKCMTGGSDGHNLFQMGKAVTYADCPPNRKDFLDSVKKQNNWVIGKETAFLQKVTSNSFKIKSSIKNSPHVMGKNIRFSYSIINSRSKRFRDAVKHRIFRRSRLGI